MSEAFAVASSQVCRRGSEKIPPRETTLLRFSQGDRVVYSRQLMFFSVSKRDQGVTFL